LVARPVHWSVFAMSSSSASSLLLGATLTCALCEDASRKLAVWCMECFAAEKGRQTPFALCHECNIDMHKPAKLATHRRQRFRCNTERMRTAAELRLPALPPDLPPLSSLMCSNCEALLDDHLEAQWCQECALILCKDCSKDLHLPQKKRVHQSAKRSRHAPANQRSHLLPTLSLAASAPARY